MLFNCIHSMNLSSVSFLCMRMFPFAWVPGMATVLHVSPCFGLDPSIVDNVRLPVKSTQGHRNVYPMFQSQIINYTNIFFKCKW